MKGKSILYVEDDVFLQSLVKGVLEERGLKVVLSTTVDDALIKIGNQKFHFFILDYNLGLNNTSESLIEVIQKLHQKVPILIMSGVLDVDIVATLMNRVNKILVKPVTPERLEDALDEFGI